MPLTPAEKQKRYRARKSKDVVCFRLPLRRRDVAKMLVKRGVISEDDVDDVELLHEGLMRILTDIRYR